MANETETLEGWYCLNDFRKIDWKGWKEIVVDLDAPHET